MLFGLFDVRRLGHKLQYDTEDDLAFITGKVCNEHRRLYEIEVRAMYPDLFLEHVCRVDAMTNAGSPED
jgi:hypothetical protein